MNSAPVARGVSGASIVTLRSAIGVGWLTAITQPCETVAPAASCAVTVMLTIPLPAAVGEKANDPPAPDAVPLTLHANPGGPLSGSVAVAVKFNVAPTATVPIPPAGVRAVNEGGWLVLATVTGAHAYAVRPAAFVTRTPAQCRPATGNVTDGAAPGISKTPSAFTSHV